MDSEAGWFFDTHGVLPGSFSCTLYSAFYLQGHIMAYERLIFGKFTWKYSETHEELADASPKMV